MKISLAQINICLQDTTLNFNKAASFVKIAADSACDLILFPELWTSGYDLDNSGKYCQENLDIIDSLRHLSLEHRIIIGGSYILRSEKGYHNSFIVIDQNGNILPIYNKLHLFSLMDENLYFVPGNHIQAIDLLGYSTGLSICYDLRFPELFTSYSKKKCDLILTTAEWPLSRISHWKALLVARAIENQVFIAATNAVGKTGAVCFGGTSMLVSPWGKIICCGNMQKEELLFDDIDISEVANARDRIPVFRDRKPDFFWVSKK